LSVRTKRASSIAAARSAANGGTVSGTVTPADVVAITGLNVTAGDFDALTDALASNTAYGNIHTTNFPAGEIRRADRDGDR
jgi:hypothetical protein